VVRVRQRRLPLRLQLNRVRLGDFAALEPLLFAEVHPDHGPEDDDKKKTEWNTDANGGFGLELHCAGKNSVGWGGHACCFGVGFEVEVGWGDNGLDGASVRRRGWRSQ